MMSTSTGTQEIPLGIAGRTQKCLAGIKKGDGRSNVLILLGRTGVGKSSLLEDLTDARGHSKDAEGEDLVTNEVQMEAVSIGEKEYFIMDTPGFDAGKMVETFYKIVRGIQAVRESTESWGVLYVTTLDSRNQTTDEALLDFIRCFFGDGFVPNLTFVTTNWNSFHERQEWDMNKKLEDRKRIWNTFRANGAQMYQHGREYSNGVDTGKFLNWYRDRNQIAQYAKDMVSRHYGNAPRRIPLIVRELEQGCPTYRTTAGFFLEPELSTISSEELECGSFPGDAQNDGPLEERASFRQGTFHESEEKKSPEKHSTREPDRDKDDDDRSTESNPDVDDDRAPRRADQSTDNPSQQNQTFLERLLAGDLVQMTFDGPTVGIRDGRLSINGVAAVKGVWQALFSATPSPNQDPSIVNFLEARGIPSDLTSRRNMAASLGLDPSTIGTATGNIELRKLLEALGH